MSQRRKLRDNMHQLMEIRNIMDAMKNLALLETVKLTKNSELQQAQLDSLKEIGKDFLYHYPYIIPKENMDGECWIIFGSERGFCGDFNESLVKYYQQQLSNRDANTVIIAVGNRLGNRLPADSMEIHRIEGADVAEELSTVLARVIALVNELQQQKPVYRLSAVFHDPETETIVRRRLTPSFENHANEISRCDFSPLLNIPAEDFFSDLLEHYIFVALEEFACASLISENHFRIQHMSGAVQRLDEKNAELLRKYNTRRQEEITEELEVILLNSDGQLEADDQPEGSMEYRT